MAAHRYWMFYSATGGDYISLSMVQFRESSGGANLTTSGNGTPMASSYAGSQTPEKPFYGTGSWSANGYPNWIAWDFGAGNSQSIRHVTIQGYGGGGLPTSAMFKYSDDGTTWADAIVNVPIVSNNSSPQVFEVYDPGTASAAISTLAVASVAYGGASVAVAVAAAVSIFGGASLPVRAPSPVTAGYGGANGAVSMTPPTFRALAHDRTGEYSAQLEAPLATLTAYGGGNASIQTSRAGFSATGTATATANAAATASPPTVYGSATNASIGTFAGALLTPKASGNFGGNARNLQAQAATLAASGVVGSVGGMQVAAKPARLLASATQNNRGSIAAQAPSAILNNTGRFSISLREFVFVSSAFSNYSPTYEAYALNLKHNTDTVDELTRYTNFPFDRIVRYQNSYYGMNSTGLYLLEGTTDFAEPTPTQIPWSWKTTMTDFGTAQLQTIRYAYFGGRMAPSAQIAIHFGDTASESYAYSTPRDTSAQNYRQEFGRGIQSRYYAFSGQGEGELSLDSINFIIAKLARKV